MLENDKIHILFASRLVWEKGVEILFDTIRATLDDESYSEKIIWHICGTGDEIITLLDLEKEYPGKVVYHGLLSREGLATIYRQVDILFMPSLFLETFGLTALESLASGTPVVGIQKGGLTAFIHRDLALDEDDPVDSFFSILENFRDRPMPLVNIKKYRKTEWMKSFRALLPKSGMTLLAHDYTKIIGGAEIYLAQLEDIMKEEQIHYSRFSYREPTTPLKRKLLFALSGLSLWRYIQVLIFTHKKKIKALWIHSFLRYIGYWGMLALMKVKKKHGAKLYLSHHDIGLLTPFPQDITSESDIPVDTSRVSFTARLTGTRKITATAKWYYIRALKKLLPRSTTHIIFSSYLEKHIERHFPGHAIIVVPHFFDEEIFHP